MVILNLCNRIIEYSFYALFFLVPLAFAGDTFELFEFNKMWLTFILTIIIGASWFIKMVLQKRIFIQRTPLDIPIILFLLSQVISTIFSWDSHISIWGYYSRFNGGLLSIITYIFLYYAFVSNLGYLGNLVNRLLFVGLLSGLVVALWGLPSHFGYDPTCLLFRGTFDVSCWVEDFQPKVRIFSTLGQPDWLAAYLAILIPISIIMFIKSIKNLPLSIFYLLLSALFYLDLLYTRARSGFLATWLSLALFCMFYVWFQRREIFKGSKFNPSTSLRTRVQSSRLILVFVVFISITFFVGQPFPQLERFTLEGIKKNITNTKTSENVPDKPPVPQKFAGELGGTDSGKIRLLVWQGAIDAWRHYPIIGTGVETFAFAYYRFRPEAHNLTSEWNFLYNKAHNEYLNYLATTGTVGLGTYSLMIGWFIFIVIRKISKSEFLISKEIQSPKSQLGQLEIKSIRNLVLALLAAYFSILLTNFFGFSVVITNIYLFLIPAFVFILMGILNPQKVIVFPKLSQSKNPVSFDPHITPWRLTLIALITIVALYTLAMLIRYWNADKTYALGYNLDRSGEYQKANPYLQRAIEVRSDEPVFKDELAINNAILAAAILSQEDTKTSTEAASLANQLVQNAITLNNFITSKHPNNIIFWKSRVRILYSVSQVDPAYLPLALEAVRKTSQLAPTDANISYNLGVLYGQNGDTKKGIEILENTIRLKPDYRDAYYALGLFYHDAAIDKDGKVINSNLQKKAIAQMQYILDNIGKDDKVVQETLEQWKKL